MNQEKGEGYDNTPLTLTILVPQTTWGLLEYYKYRHTNIGHTVEGAREGEAGVMWNFASSILHICRIHGEDMLKEENDMYRIISHKCMWYNINRNSFQLQPLFSDLFVLPPDSESFWELRCRLRRGNAGSVAKSSEEICTLNPTAITKDKTLFANKDYTLKIKTLSIKRHCDSSYENRFHKL